MEKTCNKCKAVYPATLEFYHYQKSGKHNIRATCKECAKIYRKQYTSTKEYKERHRLRMREYRSKHPEKTLEVSRKNYAIHGKKHNEVRREKYKNDPLFKAKCIEREKAYKESGRRAEVQRKPEQMAKARYRSKKRRSVTEKREHDYKKNSEWRNKNRDYINNKNAIKINELKDSYVASSMRVSVKDLTPEDIETKRLVMQLKRELKNNNVKIR